MISNAFMPLSRKESDMMLPTAATYYPNLATLDSNSKGGLLDWIRYPARRKHLFRIMVFCGLVGCWIYIRQHGASDTQEMQGWDIPNLTVGKAEVSVPKNDPQHSPISVTVPTSKTANNLIKGLVPLEKNSANLTIHSVLGEEAENAYVYGSRTLEDYYNSLSTFVDLATPQYLRSKLRNSLKRYTDNRHPRLFLREGPDRLPGLGEEAGTRNIWQTDANSEHEESEPVASWKNNDEGWQWKLLNDADASRYVATTLDGSRLKNVWDLLPSGILHSDMLRYLLLLLEGGIYSDTDTKRLKPISNWSNKARLWHEGRGWLYGNSTGLDLEPMEGVEVDDLASPSVVVGIEADVGDRQDWHDWWPRPVQIVQWTISSTPYHPIALDVIRHITHQTAEALEWQQQRPRRIKTLLQAGEIDEAERLKQATILSEPKAGGPVGVMNWTGPGVWTDAVLRYLRVKFGVQWTDLKDLQEPLRVGEVLILPVTGFSPGVGLFGAKSPFDEDAMVEHLFAGSWKGS
ncbi:hypothetical protein NliqN6_2007 [Naganishia liquefaciens]|uniref:Alpha-1,6-mannosyltransferase n=1 Tax=Naganishia liquefaciens TaxID=104408 RepID=A0A8H3TS39_9TREE|nr:hypothetical protein NliqN6_2007 [Naganishia liquefaciens]